MSIDLSLERIRVLTSLLPAYTRPTCHIAGTNGKGSVAALLSSVFASAGYTVGRFNSPHLVDVHDCISVNNAPVSLGTFHVTKEKVERVNVDHGVGASSFELLTVVALQVFEQLQLDIVVLEVGMGGRLDATNVIPDTCVLASALTAVDLDHQAFLGNTVGAIAREKAAIARAGRPLVLGPQTHAEVEDIVRAVVAQTESIFVRGQCATLRSGTGQPPTWHPPHHPPAQLVRFSMAGTLVDAEFPLHGRHQLDNLGIAVGVLDALVTYTDADHPLRLRDRLTRDAIARGVSNVRWPGRLSFHSIHLPGQDASTSFVSEAALSVLADGAHNQASATTLSAYLCELLSAFAASVPMRNGQAKEIFHLTYILALSHSPPKTPNQVLEPLLCLKTPDRVSSGVDVRISVAALEFTPPEAMPWVKPVPPSDIDDVVRNLAPNAEIYRPSELHAEPTRNTSLLHALRWATRLQHDHNSTGLVVVAGSLYLVADLYRLMDGCLGEHL